MRSWRITAWVLVSHQNTANEASNQEIAVRHKRTPLVPMYHVQQQGQMHQAMGSNPGFQPAFQAAPLISSPQKKRRAYIIESDDEDWSLKPISFSEYWGLLEFLDETCLSFDMLDWVFDTWRQSLSVLHTKLDVKAVPLFIYKPAQYCINKIFELTKSWFWNHAYDFSPNNIHGRITQFWLVNINAVFR